jgi:adenylosuccinate synthase
MAGVLMSTIGRTRIRLDFVGGAGHGRSVFSPFGWRARRMLIPAVVCRGSGYRSVANRAATVFTASLRTPSRVLRGATPKGTTLPAGPTMPNLNPSHAQNPHAASAGATAVVGLQWGDEGKGKFVDILAAEHDAVVRFNGGANAGHSVVVAGQRFSLHLIPSGILHPGKLAIIGNGVVVSPVTLLEEMGKLRDRGVDLSGLVISSRAHAVLPYHQAEDALREELLKQRRTSDEAAGGVGGGVSEIGTTKRGIGPAYADKVQRALAVRMGDLLRPDMLREKLTLICSVKNEMMKGLAGAGATAGEFDPQRVFADASSAGEKLRPMIRDTTYLLHDMIAAGKRVLFEGANGTLLDVDHGTYPFVTGSTCVVAGVGVGAGVPAQRLSRVLGIVKAYSTRVGSGPMPTELHDERGERIRQRGREFGTTTGRPRRVGWLDLVAVKYAAMLNGATGLAITLLDVLAGFDQLHVCTHYDIDGERTDRFIPDGMDLSRAKPVYQTLPGFADEISACRKLSDLPKAAREYLDFMQAGAGVKIDLVSVGPGREQTMEA